MSSVDSWNLLTTVTLETESGRCDDGEILSLVEIAGNIGKSLLIFL